MFTAIYLRSSRRDPMAIAQQQGLLEKICRDQGWEYKVFRDEVAKDPLARPGLRKLLQEVQNGGVKQVLVTSFDRLAKEKNQRDLVISKLEGCGVQVKDWYLNSPSRGERN